MDEKFVCPNCSHVLTYVKADINEIIFPVDEDGVVDYNIVSLRSTKKEFVRCERCFHTIPSDNLEMRRTDIWYTFQLAYRRDLPDH